MSKYTRIQLEDGWTMVRSTHGVKPHHYLSHTHDEESYFVNHVHDPSPNVIYTHMVCTKCGKKAPDEAIGFLRLCAWSDNDIWSDNER